MILHSRSAAPGTFVIRGARVLDPVEGIDSTLDVIVEKGVIAELAQPGGKAGGKAVAAEGLVLAPAFVDPHVHLRSPGREDEETIESGSKAAAAGGYCAILAMPNTDPVVDCATVLEALVEQAQADALIPALRRITASVGVSSLGTWSYNVGIAVYAYQETRSTTWVAVATVGRYAAPGTTAPGWFSSA